MKETIVIGLGNPLMADEGIGVVLVEKLSELAAAGEIAGTERIEFYDGGTGGMSLLHKIAGRKKVILIDCAKMRTPPGTIRRFTPADVQTVKSLSHRSLHEVDILKVVELSRQLGEAPDEIVCFGIEPERIENEAGLTPQLEEKIPLYLTDILRELN
jgi:hydrogenase maturation protease